jgi:chromosome segregation ATPase
MTEPRDETERLRAQLENLSESHLGQRVLIAAMSEERDGMKKLVEQATVEIERLRKERNEALKERDEARRMCCEFAAMVDSADTVVMYVDSNRFHEIATRYMNSRGWDCFKEDGK